MAFYCFLLCCSIQGVFTGLLIGKAGWMQPDTAHIGLLLVSLNSILMASLLYAYGRSIQ